MAPIRIGLVGLGKISVDQHLPAIAGNDAFKLVGGVSPRSRVDGLPSYPDLEALLITGAVDAVAVNTPPQVRFELARQALRAGKHVLLEKPPCATVAELSELERLAQVRGVSLYTGWHSQHAPGVAAAKDWLSPRRVHSVAMRWCEDVRQWHPGQRWIWEPGGLGVFDPGINAFSILTRILPEPVLLSEACLHVPRNCSTPIAAELRGSVGERASFEATLDFLQTGVQTWSIDIETDAGALSLTMGGADFSINGEPQALEPSREYPSIYRRFSELIREEASEVDFGPLTLVADAFLIGKQVQVGDFVE